MQTQQIDRTKQNAQAGDGGPLRCGNGTIRVLIVDDHPVARAGLRTWLEREEVIDVVDEASDGPAALERIAEAAPDVAVVDLGLPQMDGIETAARIRQSHPATRIILISGLLDAASVRRGLKAGILGFALKTDGAQRLARMVREVHAGEFCCGPDVVG